MLLLLVVLVGCTDGRSVVSSPVESSKESEPDESSGASEPEPTDSPEPVQGPQLEIPRLELVPIFELGDCGSVEDLVAVDGRVYGVTRGGAAAGGAAACAFDVDDRGEQLRLDRLVHDGVVDGVTAQLVEQDGVQTIAALWQGGEHEQLGLFERSRAGVKWIRGEPVSNTLARLGIVRDHAGDLLVTYVTQTTIFGCSRDPGGVDTEQMLWMPMAQGEQHRRYGMTLTDRVAVDEHGLVVAGARHVDLEPRTPLDHDDEVSCRSLVDVGQLDLAAAPDAGYTPFRWFSSAGAPWGDARGASVLDMLEVGDRWIVVAECDRAAWVAGLSALDGEVAWQQDLGAASRARALEGPDGGVEVWVYTHLRSNQRLLSRRTIDAEGTAGRERVMQFAVDARVRIETILPMNGRLWLGGAVRNDPDQRRSDHAWLAFVELD